MAKTDKQEDVGLMTLDTASADLKKEFLNTNMKHHKKNLHASHQQSEAVSPTTSPTLRQRGTLVKLLHCSTTTQPCQFKKVERPEKSQVQKKEEADSQAAQLEVETPVQNPAAIQPDNEVIMISDDDEEEKAVARAVTSKYPCLVEGCWEGFDKPQDRIYHARLREFDADQLHLAAYFFCKIGSCKYGVPVHEDGGKGSRKSKNALKRHMAGHRGLTPAQKEAEKHLSIERTWIAVKSTGLKPIMRGDAHLARRASRADLLPPLPKQICSLPGQSPVDLDD